MRKIHFKGNGSIKMTIQQIVAHDKWYYRSEIPLYRKRYNQMNQGYININ